MPDASSRRAGRWRARGTVLLVVGSLVLTGCGGSPEATPEPRRSSAAPMPTRPAAVSPTPTPTHAPTPAPAPSRTPTPTPSRTPSPAVDRVDPATPEQSRGLVRVVTVVGADGSGETSTGMVLTRTGEVLTNNHAVEGALSVRVVVASTGRDYPAVVVASDPRRDVAMLRLQGARELDTIRLARTGPAVRDRVTSVGVAGGRDGLTASSGSVVALDQVLVTPDVGDRAGERLTGVVLTTCDVAAGQSGGATYDDRGLVVAMTTGNVQGREDLYGIAIPTDTLRAVLRRLRAAG